MLRLVVTLTLAMAGISGAAHAGSHCASLLNQVSICALPLDEFDPATVVLSNVSGNVDITTSNQFSPADPTVPLNVGDGVIVLEDSSAFLTFGPTCARQLPEQSSLVIRVIEGCAVADLVQAQTQADATSPPNRGGLIAGALALGAAAGGIYLLSTQDGDDDEPVTPD